MSKINKDIKNDLPKGWREYKLGDVITLINGRAYGRNELLSEGKYKVIRIQNLNGGENWFYSNLELEKNKYCEKNDLLFAWSTTFGPYYWKGEKAIFHYHIWNLLLGDKISKHFAYYYLTEITEELKKNSHGVAMLHITKAMMEGWPFPLPPLPEQQRIVQKLDALFLQIDKAIQLTQQNLLHSQHLLPAALNEVFGEAADKWEEYYYDDIQQNNLIGIVKNTTQQNISLPYKYLKMNNIQLDGRLNLTNYTCVKITQDELKKFELKKGDFLFNTRNSIELVGKTCIYDLDEKQIVFNNNILRTRFKKIVNPYFINYQFKSSIIQTQLNNIKSGTTNVAAIYYKSLSKVKLQIPDLPTQQKIVTYLNELSRQQQQLQQHYTGQLGYLKALKGSLLDGAFRGEV